MQVPVIAWLRGMGYKHMSNRLKDYRRLEHLLNSPVIAGIGISPCTRDKHHREYP